MTYSYGFKKQFAIEFANFPTDQQDKVLDFADTFEISGLSDFTKYAGKISPSWSGLPKFHPSAVYAKANHLWHYHIGIPNYSVVHAKYMTSDWVLHFQWTNRGSHIDLVDLYSHYKNDGSFYLPSSNSLL
jgi:hypothetical protein